MRAKPRIVIIFLDIDGVLNSTEWAEERPPLGLIPPRLAQEALEEERIDPSCVERLRHLVAATGAQLVMSSTWRHRMAVPEFLRLFALYGWADAPIIGVTPYIAGLTRGDEVQAWLLNNDYAGAYVCLDDDEDFRKGQLLVQTDRDVGLTNLDVARCLELLAPALEDSVSERPLRVLLR